MVYTYIMLYGFRTKPLTLKTIYSILILITDIVMNQSLNNIMEPKLILHKKC